MTTQNTHPTPGTFVGRCMAIATHPATEAVIKLSAEGCKYFELIIGAPQHFDAMAAPQVRLLKRVLEVTGAKILTVHSDFSPPAQIDQPDKAAREAAMLTQRCGILFAAEVGAQAYVLHPSNYDGEQERRVRIDIAADSYAQLAEFADAQGVAVAMENMLGNHIGNTETELFEVIERAGDKGGFCLDSGHANLKARVPELAQALLGRAFTTHLHDNDTQSDRHWFPGSPNGCVDWKAIGDAYRSTGSKALLMVESNQIAYPTWQESESKILGLLGLG